MRFAQHYTGGQEEPALLRWDGFDDVADPIQVQAGLGP